MARRVMRFLKVIEFLLHWILTTIASGIILCAFAGGLGFFLERGLGQAVYASSLWPIVAVSAVFGLCWAIGMVLNDDPEK